MYDPFQAGLSFLEQGSWTNLFSDETDVGLRVELGDRGPIISETRASVLCTSEISLKDKKKPFANRET